MNNTIHKKRLLFVISRFLDGGIDTVLIEYLRYLAYKNEYTLTLAIGIHMKHLEVFINSIPKEVKVVYLNESDTLTKYPIQRVQGTISLWAKLFDELVLNPIRRFAISKGLQKMAKENDVIIDFACSYSAFMKHIDIPKIAFYHFSLNVGLQNKPHKQKKVGRRLDRYDSIITISQAMQQEFLQLFPFLQPKIMMIYNGKDLNRLQNELKTSNTLNVKTPYLLAVERLEESQKDITTLLRAMQILKEKHKFIIPLYILGKGKSEQQLKNEATRLHIEDQVVFAGFTSNPYPYIKQCAIMVHSSIFEGLPTALIEALLLDKLIICSNCPTGPREILNDGKAGILVPPGNPEKFADSIINLMENKELQEEILKGIKEHKKMFAIENSYIQLRKIIEEITALPTSTVENRDKMASCNL